MSEIVIEAMQPAYIESFREALDSVAKERRYLSLLEAPPLERAEAFVRGQLEKGNPQFVALDNERVVGWCDIRRHERETQAHRGLLGMGIIDGYRDKGIGRELLGRTMNAVRRMGLHRIELEVYADNQRAIRLYERFGFLREGLMRDAVFLDGRFVDLVLMALIFPVV
ncbi:GNAT family N-acetyltransferase [Allorhizobium sp. BGMRC 0089]|uniref:GNAT family N-acetyltransferase n=1 Tax=Allorhizobium sonneratiae TaxID=2934936 RepID=UPI0020346535|nr:GNAT family protein [Allorhizobium sonneratiae]MCM2291166.1 GNAT family N-acetyltransferase [Allorhizobium sonneratiae]